MLVKVLLYNYIILIVFCCFLVFWYICIYCIFEIMRVFCISYLLVWFATLWHYSICVLEWFAFGCWTLYFWYWVILLFSSFNLLFKVC